MFVQTRVYSLLLLLHILIFEAFIDDGMLFGIRFSNNMYIDPFRRKQPQSYSQNNHSNQSEVRSSQY